MRENDVTLTVYHNINSGETTITGGMGNGASVEIFEGADNTITWQAQGNTGRWAFDGIVLSPTGSLVVDTSTANQIVVTEGGGPGTGTYTYALRIRNVTTGVVITTGQDPSQSSMIVKKASPVVK